MKPSPLRSTPIGTGHGTSARRAILAGLIACASYSGSACAAYYGYPFNMLTGTEVISMLSGGTGAPGDDRQRDYARYYVAGIKDGTEGRLWCFTGKQKPDELTADIARTLREKHSSLVLKGNAGPLLVDELRLRYPCKTAGTGYPFNTLTGKQVVEKLLDGKDTLAEERESGLAYHYVAGIKDGTQGTLWCFTGNLKPNELTYEIMHDLRRKHSAAVLQGNAGPLIVEELRLRYPCKSSRRARP